MDIEIGNCETLDTKDTGWFIGFSDWAKTGEDDPNLRFMPKDAISRTIHAKWMMHPKGDDRGTRKPPSDGRTISILVSDSGHFRVQFAPTEDFDPDETKEVSLEQHGDFVIWGEEIHHRWYVDSDCTVLTLRWVPK